MLTVLVGAVCLVIGLIVGAFMQQKHDEDFVCLSVESLVKQSHRNCSPGCQYYEYRRSKFV